MLKIPKRVRESAIKRFVKSCKSEANSKLAKGHTNGNKVAYLDGYTIIETDEDIGLEILPENESIKWESIKSCKERTNNLIREDYSMLCDYIKRAKQYEKDNGKDKDLYIYPIIADNYTVFVNANRLKMLMEITQEERVQTEKYNQPIHIENKELNIYGLMTPVCVKGVEENTIKQYKMIMNYGR